MRDVGLWREAHAICMGSYGIFGLVAFFSPILTGTGSGSRPDHDAMRNVSFVVMFSMMLSGIGMMIYMASYVTLGALATSDDLLPARHFQRKKQLIGHSAASAFLIAGSIFVAVQPQAAILVTLMAFMNVLLSLLSIIGSYIMLRRESYDLADFENEILIQDAPEYTDVESQLESDIQTDDETPTVS